MRLTFTKMHALGNDFIVIDGRHYRLRGLPHLSKKLCHRRFGIGADQLLILCNSRTADFRMRIFNADGTEVEMCGNGIRCLARYIWDKGLRRHHKLSIETRAGIIHLQKKGQGLIRVDMGEPILKGAEIPVRAGSSHVVDYPLTVRDRTFKITCVSMGNPHAVIVVRDVDTFPVSDYGPLVENDPFFPKRTNVEFIEVLDTRNIKMRVWERGCGETMACGTGASASAVAASLLGLTERSVNVHLPGGRLQIEWSPEDNHVYMTGPAVNVFEGVIKT